MPHYLQPNCAARVPSYHVCVDTETVPLTPSDRPGESHHRLMLGCARSWRYRAGDPTGIADTHFVTRRAWWDWLYSRLIKGTKTWVWAHNMAFDATVLGLWDEIDAKRLRIKQPASRPRGPGGPDDPDRPESASLITSPFCFLAECVTPEGHSIRFIDTTNFCPIALAKLGPMVGLEKLPIPGEVADDLDWLEYCKRDVEVLYRVVDRICDFVRRHDLGNMQCTLGGQAMSHYRHRHLDSRIVVGPDPDVRPLERDGYYGARTQVYFRGRLVEPGTEAFPLFARAADGGAVLAADGVCRIDCNGCYPHVMRHHRYPTRIFRRLFHPPIEELKSMIIHMVAVASVRLFSPLEPWPCRRDGKTVWRVGKVHTVLCGPELERALRMGVVDAVDYCQVYACGPIFASWGEEVQRWRDEARVANDEFDAAMLKRMANSLHGKFGQRGTGWETVPGQVPAMPWGVYSETDIAKGVIRECRGVGALKQVFVREDEAAGSCPAIAAWVTAHAREHVRACREAAGPQSVLYEDADSLHVLPAGMERLRAAGWIDPHEPGKFKIEAEAATAEYVGPKHYRFGDQWLVPGHALSGRYDAKGLWSQTEWVGMDQLLASGKPEAPITVERGITHPTRDSEYEYSEYGWVRYRQG